jgi:AraC-like DNA-binding protein/uncharacterized cupin superfamily protein
MKPSFQELKSKNNDSIATYWVKAHTFGFHWHYHPEIELCYVHSGTGTRMIGDSVNEFKAGDLVLIGGNLPHTWISQKYVDKKSEAMQVFVIQFLPDLLPVELLNNPSFLEIKKMLQKASKGIFIKENLQLKSFFDSLVGLKEVEKFIELLQLLNKLSQENNIELLASDQYSPLLSGENQKRMIDVFGYIHNHYTENISLKQIADIACLNEASFCRYFGKNTGQTFTEYVNDLRINQACQLIRNSDKSILEISQEVGFNSYTNFNRCFVKRKNRSPRVFKNDF